MTITETIMKELVRKTVKNILVRPEDTFYGMVHPDIEADLRGIVTPKDPVISARRKEIFMSRVGDKPAEDSLRAECAVIGHETNHFAGRYYETHCYWCGTKI